MKGSSPTNAQRRYWDALASNVGCIACAKNANVTGLAPRKDEQ